MSLSLTDEIKRLARRLGAAAVGVASRKELTGPPEADMGYVMPEAQTAVVFFVVLDEGLIAKYLGKEDPWPYRNHFFENIQRLGDIGRGVAEALRTRSFKAAPQSPNAVYRPGSNMVSGLLPPFSLRYGAFAAGLGTIGRSGLLLSPKYGARIQLGGVITDAPLAPDSPLTEKTCRDCLMCVASCPTGFMSRTETVTFTLGGREITHAKKSVHARCAVACGGLTGLSKSGKWSTWSTGRWRIEDDDRDFLQKVVKPRFDEMAADHGGARGYSTFSRVLQVDGYERPGILARSREDTLVTCGNCSIICVGDEEKTKALYRLLTRSGVVIENDDGEVAAVPPQEARRILAAREKSSAEKGVEP